MTSETEADSALPEPAPAEIRLATVLHALADPVRLRIVRELAAGHCEMSCIAFGLPVSKSTSTHHFRVLREAGVIRQHRRGTSRMSVLRSGELAALFPGLLDSVLSGAAGEEARAPGELAETPTMG
ncbi:DNA-binding transcriptional ArsR family regulator [Kitasatospora sp. MAP12-15]|uniref:ArsR/SmtB family transcription factor n=1 Tax=unclassified Kitasatospora TaxID=2633591 RepID=UPI0024744544|nr:metalloregulator ArsR/SmtB family transcription factor [Kitasatospora sp. MAP12-44]MDH6109036.1 DNA-binding transcriptional ArsR family regulator [Kitasatospora sp. MAP12-44]